MNDLRFALRQLGRRPGFTAATILTLALGIGANTAIFSVLYESWLRPLPFPNADRLVSVGERQKGYSLPLAPGNYLDLKANARGFAGMAAYTPSDFTIADETRATRVEGVRVTPDFFQVLGLGPRLGRGFTADDGAEDAPRVVVLSYRLWRERFGGDRGIVGKTVRIDVVPYTVVGVTPPGFSMRSNPYVTGEAELFVPLRFTAGDRQTHGSRWIFGLGRLTPDATVASASRELAAAFDGIRQAHPEIPDDVSAGAREYRPILVGRKHTSLLLLGGAALLVLLVACVNVANLLLVRSETRTRELAVRAALGAGRVRLARTFLTEGLLLAFFGGLAGIAVAFWGVDLLVQLYAGILPRASQIAVHPDALGFALALAIVTGVLVGLAPALLVDPKRLMQGLKAGGRGAVGSRSRLRGALVVGEVAVTAVLVAGAGVLIHSFRNLSNVDPGLKPEHALAFQVGLPQAQYRDRASVTGFYDALLEGVRALPGVQDVGGIDRQMFGGGFNRPVKAVGAPDREVQNVELRQVTPDFFAAAGILLLEGRTLNVSDGASGREVVLISRELARRLFPGRDPIGERLDLNLGSPLDQPEIVGVVGDVREFGPTEDPAPRFYWAYPAGYANPSMTFVVRASGDPTALVPAIRRVVAGLDTDVPVYGVASLGEIVGRTFGSRRLVLSLLAVFACVALLLAAVGVYGVIAYTVSARAREVGLRLALGAEAPGVQRMVLGQGLRLAGWGVAIGLAGAVALGYLLRSLLWGVSPGDPFTLVAVAALLLFTALVASFLPARRAARIDPVEALRLE